MKGCLGYYLNQEFKKGFKDWTKEGLEHLLKNKDLSSDMKNMINKKLGEFKNE